MSDEAALLAAIAAAPDDPLVRLVYADFLDDHGDPRAELLRLDVELSSRPPHDRDTPALLTRLVTLASTADAAWRAAVYRVPTTFDGWLDLQFCDCDGPTAAAPGLFTRDAEGRHALIRQPTDPSEVAAVCRAARDCHAGAVHFFGADPVVERLLWHNAPRFTRPWTPPPPVPRIYGGHGAGVAAGRLVEPDQPPNRRTMGWIGLGCFLLWLTLPLSCCLRVRL